MNAKNLRIILIVVLAFTALLSLSKTTKVLADAPPDVLDSYAISVVPQQDGTLVMNYALQNYCTASDWPSDQPYLQIGVPNDNFSINDWGPKDGTNGKNKVIGAEAVSGSLVQLNFDPNNLPKNGDCFNLNFSIVQNKMAYPDPNNGNVTFEFFAAGWKFPIQVKVLTLNWAFPKDPTLVKLTDPAPTGKDTVNMTWQWQSPSMDASNMFSSATVKLAYDKSAFTLSDAATTTSNSANGGVPSDLGTICFWAIVIVIVVILVLLVIAAFARSIDSGDGLGTAFVSVVSDVAEAVSSAGGEGGSSGNSSGCASMSSCACACACAAGGKVGCMLKMLGIKMGCLKKVIEEMTKPDEKKE